MTRRGEPCEGRMRRGRIARHDPGRYTVNSHARPLEITHEKRDKRGRNVDACAKNTAMEPRRRVAHDASHGAIPMEDALRTWRSSMTDPCSPIVYHTRLRNQGRKIQHTKRGTRQNAIQARNQPSNGQNTKLDLPCPSESNKHRNGDDSSPS